MYNLPIEFYSEAKATKEIDQPWVISSGTNNSACAIPTEFGGKGGGFSPEDLFLQAAINCFIGTFKVIAKLSKVSFSSVQVSGKLSVNKNEARKIVMKSINLDICIFDCDQKDRIETLVAKTIRDGFILNSINSEISYSLKCLGSESTKENI